MLSGLLAFVYFSQCVTRLIISQNYKLTGDLVLGAGLEPACLSAYAPQTYVSAIPPPER